MISDWLQTPLSGAASHELAPWAYWHARLMVAAWAILLPLGALLARFYKVTPRQDWPRQLDSKFWWHGHRALQYGGVFLMAAGLALAWNQGLAANLGARWHAALGWALAGVAGLQIVSAWLRGSKGGPTEQALRGDHYDMTAHRLAFEFWHKSLGWLGLAVAIAVIILGLVVADAPRWMVLALALWWLGLGAAFVRLQSQGRCIDTYQAIWGPSQSHPGNQRPATSWGARRPMD